VSTSWTEQEPTFDELLTMVAKREQDSKFGSIPARVLVYDDVRQVVDVQPLVMITVADELRLIPPIREVQVRWLSGAGWSLVGVLEAGDFGWLKPAGADISAWKASGSENSPTVSLRKQSLSDCYFDPGGRPLSLPLDVSRYSRSGPVFAGDPVILGSSSATDFVALALRVLTELQNIKEWADLHVHSGVTTGVGSTGVPTVPMPVPGSVAATKVMAI
jgi:hypothetical protein